jgi:tyrosyl-tRNA synthetase
LVGRQLQKDAGLSQQVCLMMPLLVGTDGVNKMSKSYDNYIGLDESPNDMYGKALSIPDNLIYDYFELVTDVPTDKLAELKSYADKDPRNAKHDLALALTKMYFDEEAALSARKHFEQTIINKDIPDQIEEYYFDSGSAVRLIDIIVQLNFATSNGEARRLIQQGGVTIDGNPIKDATAEIVFSADRVMVLKVGKRKFGKLKSK